MNGMVFNRKKFKLLTWHSFFSFDDKKEHRKIMSLPLVIDNNLPNIWAIVSNHSGTTTEDDCKIINSHNKYTHNHKKNDYKNKKTRGMQWVCSQDWKKMKISKKKKLCKPSEGFEGQLASQSWLCIKFSRSHSLSWLLKEHVLKHQMLMWVWLI